MAFAWSWMQLASGVGAAVLVPLVLHRVFLHKRDRRKTRDEFFCSKRDYMREYGFSQDDAEFQVAVDFISRRGKRLSNDKRLTLYALFKQAQIGPCDTEKPSAADLVASSKWQHWHALGDMDAHIAKQQYIACVEDLFPDFDIEATEPPSDALDVSEQINKAMQRPDSVSTVGPVSTPTIDMTTEEWQVKHDAFHYASTGDMDKIHEALQQDSAIDQTDDEGRTMLHWAVDREQESVVQALLAKGASVNVQDNEGMTPLHYAVNCDSEEVAQLLLSHGAERDIKDNDGETPVTCADSEAMQKILSMRSTS